MKKIAAILLSCALSMNVFANDFDLKAAMKEMGLEFKQAAKATNVEEMQRPVKRLTDLVLQSKTGEYPAEKQDLYMQGFEKLHSALVDVQGHLDNQDLEAAQQALRVVDDLRVEYHDRRNPSIWSLIFG
ncbi:cytochrome b562 [Vibrio sonorensis]|uniref:cytochrome b562 n=1 Tax=Vibrio sonorensis TaxID=1004316 RepID=UPI0008D9EA46|nr:cytochrome b562 [Vibrio sonorensis]